MNTPLRWLFVWPLLGATSAVLGQPALPIVDGLRVTAVAHPPAGPEVRLAQPLGRKGPTSIRFFPSEYPRQVRPSPNPADPAGSKYLTKDRDLGQTFTTPAGAPFRLIAVTLRVGSAPLGNDIAGVPRALVFLQLFEVTGTPVIHDNGTTGSTTVSVSYPGKAMADDYITGETYDNLLIVRGGVLPAALTVGEGNSPTPTTDSSGTLLRFDLTAIGGVILQPSRRYAFLVGFENAALSRALPLDNWDYLNQDDAPPESIATGPYSGGHAIRREGRVAVPSEHLRDALEEVDARDPVDHVLSSFLPDFAARVQQPPGTWGRPDVDTYRDLTFWIEGSDAAESPSPPSVMRREG